MSANKLYLDFFELRERPFTLVPDPGFLFWSAQHKRAYSVLQFGILSSAPVTLITGDIGAGKTTLLQALLNEIPDDVTIGLVSNAQGDRGELLQWVLNAFSVDFESSASYVETFQILQDFVLERYAAGSRVILIFDEAQNLSMEALEELRMLTNMNSNKDVLIQLILAGQPELRDMVQSRSMQQLAQRVAASFHLGTMDVQTTISYIGHRLHSAGGSGEEFTPAACRLIHQHAGGVPRLVNQLCEFALLYAWDAEARSIDDTIVKHVLDDGVFFRGYRPSEEPLVLFRNNGNIDG
ncbi:MAG: AAA family ATPase [Pseudomonadota bacterium]